MLLREILLPGVVLPAGAALVVALLDQGWRRARPASAPRLGGAALAAAFVAAFTALDGVPTLPPIETGGWLFWASIVTGLLGLAWAVLPASARLAVAAVMALGLVGLSARPLLQHTWTTAEAAAWLSASVAAIALSWWGLERLARGRSTADEGGGEPRRGWLLGVCTALVLLVAAVVLGLSASLFLAQLSGALAVAIVTWTAARWLMPRPPGATTTMLGPGSTPTVAVVLGGLLLNGLYYAEVPPLSFAALALAPPAAAIGLRWTAPSAGRRWAVALAGLLLACAAALVPVVHEELTAGDEGGSYYDYD